ncbi:ABC transporter ATP-binding protein [bacterium]|nr:ABC transporter ATP-binding protein [bacterium]
MINLKNLILKYKYKFLLIIFLIITISLINTLLPYIIKQAIALAENGVKFYDIKFKLFFLVGIYLIITFICVILEFLKSILLAKNTQCLIYDIRETTYKRIMNFNMDTFSNMHISTLVTRMTSDISNIGEFIGRTLPMFLSSGIFLVVVLIVMCFINIYFALIMIICSIFLVIAILKIGKRMARYKKKEIEVTENLNNYFGETFSSIKTLHIFNIQNERRKIFNDYNVDELKISNKYFDSQSFLTPVRATTRYFIIFLILYLCLQGKIANVDIGIIYLVVNYIDKFFEPLGNMLYHYEDIQKGKISMSRIDELMGKDENIENIYKGEIAEKLYGNIKFSNVSFSYVEEKNILENINFSINKGEKIALVGETGAGKTTIINLILGFYKINSGNIMFDGKNIDDISLESLRKNISFIQQKPYVFNDTIKRNIIVNNESNLSDEKIIDILKLVGLYNKVTNFKNGIYECVNDNSFSKGEKQLLAFARAIAKETSIYIFDEPTSNVDIENEKKIKKIINDVLKNATIIIIAHRPATIDNVDRVFRVKNKKVVIQNIR